MNLALDAGGLFVPGAVGLGTAKRAVNGAEVITDTSRLLQPNNQVPLLDTQRGNLLNNVENKKLKNIIKNNYRPNARVGSGSTADAVRQELKTNIPIGNRGFHFQKAQDSINGLNNLVNQGVLGSGDLQKAQFLLDDLSSSLKGVQKSLPK